MEIYGAIIDSTCVFVIHFSGSIKRMMPTVGKVHVFLGLAALMLHVLAASGKNYPFITSKYNKIKHGC